MRIDTPLLLVGLTLVGCQSPVELPRHPALRALDPPPVNAPWAPPPPSGPDTIIGVQGCPITFFLDDLPFNGRGTFTGTLHVTPDVVRLESRSGEVFEARYQRPPDLPPPIPFTGPGRLIVEHFDGPGPARTFLSASDETGVVFGFVWRSADSEQDVDFGSDVHIVQAPVLPVVGHYVEASATIATATSVIPAPLREAAVVVVGEVSLAGLVEISHRLVAPSDHDHGGDVYILRAWVVRSE